jgi:hypothetical protein
VSGGHSPEEALHTTLSELARHNQLTRRMAPLRQSRETVAGRAGRPGSGLAGLARDLRHSVRGLRKSPALQRPQS